MKAAILSAILCILLCGSSAAAPQRVIDVHMHSYPKDGPWPPIPLTELMPKAQASKQYAGILAPTSFEEHQRRTLVQMHEYHVVLGLIADASNEHDLELAEAWRRSSNPVIRPGLSKGQLVRGEDVAALEKLFRNGTFFQLGELGLEYSGLTADDPRFESYFAMAERLDIPVCIHTGLGPPRTANRDPSASNFRVRYGSPIYVEDALVKHPELRLWLMHGGWPFMDDTIAILNQYPEVYVDLAVLPWVLPQAEFYDWLHTMIDAGFADRIMFGSDQMRWPETIGISIERVEEVPFLTREQKDAIFFGNAIRFFRLNPADYE
ncbi:MAG TPA: amidohydrolase family protein [Candidatus Krumholzibacteria bacterium]|nr:amidohydrolase family protein [Candidatus Krumholzibacteria bacterium]